MILTKNGFFFIDLVLNYYMYLTFLLDKVNIDRKLIRSWMSHKNA